MAANVVRTSVSRVAQWQDNMQLNRPLEVTKRRRRELKITKKRETQIDTFQLSTAACTLRNRNITGRMSIRYEE